jgi:hypothetical protein
MIDWPKLLVAVIVARGNRFNKDYDHYSVVARWIASRINRRLAGYGAMKNTINTHLNKCEMSSCKTLCVFAISSAQQAEVAYKEPK